MRCVGRRFHSALGLRPGRSGHGLASRLGEVQRQRIEALRAPPIGFAHRGARADAPENTLEAFEVALASGATGLESDVWLTADGEVVLDHDGVVRKGWRKHPISSYVRRDLPTHIPTLEELYADCGVDYELSLDMKDRGALDATIAVARSAGAEGRLWICDPDPEVLADWRHRVGAARLVNSTRLERIREASNKANFDPDKEIVTSRSKSAQYLKDELKVTNVPDGFTKWQLPISFACATQTFLSFAAPDSKALRHSHKEGPGIRVIISGSLFTMEQSLWQAIGCISRPARNTTSRSDRWVLACSTATVAVARNHQFVAS